MLADFALPAAHVSHTLETAKERIAAGLGAKLAEMKTRREELFPWEVYAHECEHVLQAQGWVNPIQVGALTCTYESVDTHVRMYICMFMHM